MAQSFPTVIQINCVFWDSLSLCHLHYVSMRRSLLVTSTQILLFRPYEQQKLLIYALSFAKKITSQPGFGLLCLSPRLWAIYKVLFRLPIESLHKYGDGGGLVSYVHTRNPSACQRITKRVKHTHESSDFQFYKTYIWHKLHLSDSRRYRKKGKAPTITQK